MRGQEKLWGAIAAIREALELSDATARGPDMRQKLAACLIVAAELECRIVGIDPTARNVERVAGYLVGAGQMAGFDLIAGQAPPSTEQPHGYVAE